jgi:hypothetical protein
MARARDERQIKTVDIARGLFIVRYATSSCLPCKFPNRHAASACGRLLFVSLTQDGVVIHVINYPAGDYAAQN